jgi:hypothetical protein
LNSDYDSDNEMSQSSTEDDDLSGIASEENLEDTSDDEENTTLASAYRAHDVTIDPPNASSSRSQSSSRTSAQI